MAPPRRILITATVSTLIILLLLHRSGKETWRDRAHGLTRVAAEKVGLGEHASEWIERNDRAQREAKEALASSFSGAHNSSTPATPPPPTPSKDWKSYLIPGTPRPDGENYTRTLVIPKTKKEDISWMDKEIPEMDKVVYVADDPSAPLHPPANKGHEAMVYLTYIIDHYDNLPDIMLFMHAHQKTWHNNDVFNGDAAEIVRRLSSARVTREGYMNLRCQWFPGCPDWMHPGNTEFDVQKTEQVLIAKAWAEIFPFDPVPEVLAQPCCSQFAVSKERIRSIPKARFEYYRTWILDTKLKDFISGRVWEYLWQYAFTGQNYFCPVEHICYCDGYGACFGGPEKYAQWNEKKKERDKYNLKLLKWQQQKKRIEDLTKAGKVKEAGELEQPEEGKDFEWWDQIQRFQKEMDVMSKEAIERGRDPKQRALEAGRTWKEGDGY